jgi:hypothetical protein
MADSRDGMKTMVKRVAAQPVHFRVVLNPHEKIAVAVVVILGLLIALFTYLSADIGVGVFGLYLQLLGAIMLGFGLTRTNDELVALANHYENLHKPSLMEHLTRDRFFVVFGVFLLATGLLLQIVGLQFF